GFCGAPTDPCNLEYIYAGNQSAIRSGSTRIHILPRPDVFDPIVLTTGSGTVKVPEGALSLSYFIVGGGGGGGNNLITDGGGAGGGGRGQVATNGSNLMGVEANSTIIYTVGNGGSGLISSSTGTGTAPSTGSGGIGED